MIGKPMVATPRSIEEKYFSGSGFSVIYYLMQFKER